MPYKDQTLTCRDCSTKFVYTAWQQELNKKNGFNTPTRCAECHAKRKSRRNYSRGRSCKMYSTTCAACGNETRVPFEPSEDKPVYCVDCFKEQRNAAAADNTRPFTLRASQDVETNTEGPVSEAFGKFELDKRLERAIVSAGYTEPTRIQSTTIPILLTGRDLIGTAQTGTGKTAAFVLPILQYLLSSKPKKPRTRALILTPTRELAEQVNTAVAELGKYTDIRSASVYGGVSMEPQENALSSGVEVIVACPGRLIDHMERGTADLSGVEKLVLDEADRMLDMGFLPAIKRILSKLPRNRQTMLFSATFAPELMELTRDAMKSPKRIQVDLQSPAKTVAHALYPCAEHLKTPLLLRLLNETDMNSVLIFTRTKHRANRVAKQLERVGHGVRVMHSNKSQNQRQTALDDFREGRCQILVATDIAARGLDIETISHVINYDIPDNADAYIHRIGRTGRAEREGDAMTLVTKLDAAAVFEIERALRSPIEKRTLEGFDYHARPASERVSKPVSSNNDSATAVEWSPKARKPRNTERFRGRKKAE